MQLVQRKKYIYTSYNDVSVMAVMGLARRSDNKMSPCETRVVMYGNCAYTYAGNESISGTNVKAYILKTFLIYVPCTGPWHPSLRQMCSLDTILLIREPRSATRWVHPLILRSTDCPVSSSRCTTIYMDTGLALPLMSIFEDLTVQRRQLYPGL